MARRLPYLQRRGDVLHFRIAVPADLRAAFACRELTRSLRASDRSQAHPIALELAATAHRLFNQVRAQMGDGTDSDELRQLISKKRQEFQLDKLAEQHQNEIIELRRRHLKELEIERLKARVDALESISSGTESIPAPTSEPPTRPDPGATRPSGRHRLSEALPIWAKLENPKPTTIDIYSAAVQRFEELYPTLRIETIEKKHIREYVQRLSDMGLKSATVEKEHGAIRVMLNIAVHEEWITTNPASRTRLPKKGDSTDIRSFTPEELRQIFSDPVFTGGKRPRAGKGEAAFWIPLLLLFTGARREEVARLQVGHIRQREGIHYIAMDGVKEREEKTAKRAIPIHNELVRLGFLEYVKLQRKQKHEQLFHHLIPKNDRFGVGWGNWWQRYLRTDIGITDKEIAPAHSFRHLFITECRRLAFREDYERFLVGHSKGSDVHSGYGEHLLAPLNEAIARIDFQGLDLGGLKLYRR